MGNRECGDGKGSGSPCKEIELAAEMEEGGFLYHTCVAR